MAPATGDPPNDPNGDPSAHQDFTSIDDVRAKRGRHGATVIDPIGVSERSFMVVIRVARGKEHQVNQIHRGLLEKMIEACNGIVFRPTSTSVICSTRPITKIDQFPSTEIAHNAFFDRKFLTRSGQKSVEIQHKIQSRMTVKEIKTAVMSYLVNNNTWIERGELDSVEVFRFGFFQYAHPNMTNRLELAEAINNVVSNFIDIDKYWDLYAPNWPRDKELPKISVFKQHIPWGAGTQRVVSECICLCAIRPVCVLMKHIITESQELFAPYIFVQSGHAAMNDREKFRQVLIHNNDFQNAVQGLSIIGLSRIGMYTELTRGDDTKTIHEWLLDFSGIEQVESTEETDSKGRWITIVLRDEFENAKSWIDEILSSVDDILSDTERQSCIDTFEYFPPCLYVRAPLGGSMQRSSEASYTAITTRGERYSTSSSSNRSNTNKWEQPRRLFFDAPNTSSFPALLPKDNTTKNQQDQDDANSAASTVKTSRTRTDKTTTSTDLDTVVTRFESVFSQQSQSIIQQSQAIDKLIQENKEERAAARALREADKLSAEALRSADRQESKDIILLLLQESKDRQLESDKRHERLLQETRHFQEIADARHTEHKKETSELLAKLTQTTSDMLHLQARSSHQEQNEKLLNILASFTHSGFPFPPQHVPCPPPTAPSAQSTPSLPSQFPSSTIPTPSTSVVISPLLNDQPSLPFRHTSQLPSVLEQQPLPPHSIFPGRPPMGFSTMPTEAPGAPARLLFAGAAPTPDLTTPAMQGQGLDLSPADYLAMQPTPLGPHAPVLSYVDDVTLNVPHPTPATPFHRAVNPQSHPLPNTPDSMGTVEELPPLDAPDDWSDSSSDIARNLSYDLSPQDRPHVDTFQSPPLTPGHADTQDISMDSSSNLCTPPDAAPTTQP